MQGVAGLFHRLAPLLAAAAATGGASAVKTGEISSGVGAQCALTEGYDFNGNDLLGPSGKPQPQPVADPAACCELCATKPTQQQPRGNCSAWSFSVAIVIP